MASRERVLRVLVPVLSLTTLAGLVWYGSSDHLPSSTRAGVPLAAPASGQPGSGRAPGSSQATPAGQAPATVPKGWACPSSAPFAAYGIPYGFHFYGENHPTHPDPSRKPTSCYRTATEATAAGFTLGLPPQGWDQANGLVLAPILELRGGSAWLRTACADAGRTLGFTTPCLQLVPNPARGSTIASCGSATPANPGCIADLDGTSVYWVQDRGFPGLDGKPTGGQGLTVASAPTKDAGPGSAFRAEFLCGGAAPSSTISLVFFLSFVDQNARPASFIDCRHGSGPSAGQRLLTWDLDGVTFVVGVPFDEDSGAGELLQAIARSISFVVSQS